MRKLKKYVLVKGVKLFCDYVPARVLKIVLPEVDHIKLRNGLITAARMTEII